MRKSTSIAAAVLTAVLAAAPLAASAAPARASRPAATQTVRGADDGVWTPVLRFLNKVRRIFNPATAEDGLTAQPTVPLP